jgi:hypothetical protein
MRGCTEKGNNAQVCTGRESPHLDNGGDSEELSVLTTTRGFLSGFETSTLSNACDTECFPWRYHCLAQDWLECIDKKHLSLWLGGKVLTHSQLGQL